MAITKEQLLEKYADEKHINRRTWIESNYGSFISKSANLSSILANNNDNLTRLSEIDSELATDSTIVGLQNTNESVLQEAINDGNLDALVNNIIPEIQGNLANNDQLSAQYRNEKALDPNSEKTKALEALVNSNLALRNESAKLLELSDKYQKAIQKDLDAVQEKLDTIDRLDRNRLEASRVAELEASKSDIRGDTSLNSLTIKQVSTTFKEQCFMLQNIYEIIDIKRKFMDELTKLPYEEGKSSGFNRPLQVETQPFGFINRLTQQKSTAQLFNMPNSVLSQLQPMVRLYKVDENNNQIPIEFPSKIEFGKGLKKTPNDITKYLKGNNRRGFGVGLKDFSFTFKGSDPFAVKKSIEASLTIYAASFEELLEEREFKNFKYSYADLALKTGTALMEQNVVSDKSSKAVIDNLDKLKFRLKAVVGYELPNNLHIPKSPGLDKKTAAEIRQQIKDAVNNSFTTLALTPTIHEFKFREGGEIEFKINYLSYIEDFFDQSYFNIFSDVRVTSESYERKLLIKRYEELCLKDKIENEKKLDAKKFKQLKADSLRTLIETMIQRGRVYHFKVPYEKLANFAEDPLSDESLDIFNTLGITDDISDTTLDPKKDAKGATSTTDSSSKVPEAITINSEVDTNSLEQINYFYLNDLIAIIMENIETSLSSNGYIKSLEKIKGKIGANLYQDEKRKLTRMLENYRNLRVVLGPIEIRNPRKPGVYKNVSLGDIPISLTYFAEWMTSKIVARDRIEYSLSAFVNDFIKNYVRNFLNSEACFGGKVKQRLIVYNSNISSYSQSEYDEISAEIFDAKRKAPAGSPESKLTRYNMPSLGLTGVLNTMGSRDLPNPTKHFLKQTNYMIFYAGRSQPQKLMAGDREIDLSNGIFHYILGKNNGIVKKIDLTRTNVTGLKELRFEQEGFDGLQQLREVYDANIDTFLNSTAYPGTYIFINPRGFAPGTSNYSNETSKFNKLELSKYGIGGYFMIIESSHRFAEGLAESKITAKWVAGLESDATPAGESGTKIESQGNKKQKCAVSSTKILDVQMSIPGATDIPDTVGVTTD
tara:strand:- start:3328 stop:6486 length:3159 start_codon:yes stop_codon:yes gene_type:complete